MGSNPKKYLHNGKNHIYATITEGSVYRKMVTIIGGGGGTNGLIIFLFYLFSFFILFEIGAGP